ncbi:MAG: lipopolysaccharide kinase InaA family protein [Sulfurimonadaceae bacterium]
MSFKIEVAPLYPAFTSILTNIKSLFRSNGETIHKARNELKIIELEGIACVVKAFRVPNIINQFAYAYIRKSKAYKSYHNAMQLQELGVNTPAPIGYIEFYDKGLIQESFFISEHYKYDFTMAHVRDDDPADKQAILEAFAAFTYAIHLKGVWHVDYSGGNILINRKESDYEFSLVDINRMEFRKVSGYEGLENFNKMWFDEDALRTIAKKYAQLADLDETRAVNEVLAHDQKLKAHVLRRRKIKALFKK